MTISADITSSIFTSIPRSVTISNRVYQASVEWADTANITKALSTKPLAVTIRTSSDVVADEYTSKTMYAGAVTYGARDQTQKVHQYRRCTLSISTHAKNTTHVAAYDIINAYVEALQMWAMTTLRDLTSGVEDLGVQDLSYLADKSERRDMALYIVYEQSLSTSVPNINSIETPIIN